MYFHRRWSLFAFRLLSLATLLVVSFAPVGRPVRAAAVIHETQRLAPVNLAQFDARDPEIAISGNRMLAANTGGGTILSKIMDVFEPDTHGVWQKTDTLFPSDPTDSNSAFGDGLALSGDTAFIGASDAPVGDVTHAGAVYVFERDPYGRWHETQKIVPHDPIQYGDFGTSLAIDGSRLAVGAIYSTNYGETALGSVYIFERGENGSWQEVAKILSNSPTTDDRMGVRVALSGDTLIASDAGREINGLPEAGVAYVYQRDASGQWPLAASLLPGVSGAFGYFGYSIALHGDQAAIGAPFEYYSAGVVYIFERDGSGNWHQVARLLPSDTLSFDQFGWRVALEQGDLLIGAPGKGSESMAAAGAAYRFQRDANGSWNEVSKLMASDAAMDDHFGQAVALSDGLAMVETDPEKANSSREGAVYSFGLPMPALSAPPPGSLLRTGIPTFAGSAVSGSTVYVREGTDLLCTTVVDAAGAWSCAPDHALPDGRHRITATASSNKGPARLTFTIDTQTLTITRQPQDTRICLGGNASFDAAAAGYMLPSVQWLESPDGVRWQNIAGADQTTLTLNHPAASLDGYYYKAAFATGDETLDSAAARLRIEQIPSISIQASQRFYRAGDVARYTAQVAGSSATIRWQMSSDAGKTWQDVPGATGITLNFSVQPSQLGNLYRASAENTCGASVSNALGLGSYKIFLPSVEKGS